MNQRKDLIKNLLLAFSFISAISGIAVIIVGVDVLADVKEYNCFTNTEILAPCIVLIVAGPFILITAFLGCLGTIRESYAILIAFPACLLIIFTSEMAVGSAAAVYKSVFEEDFPNALNKSMLKYDTNPCKQLAWDMVQTKLMCCGTAGFADWEYIQHATPDSCCKFMNCSLGCSECYHEEGCLDKLIPIMQEKFTLLIGIGIGTCFLQIVGIALAFLLTNSIKAEYGKLY